MTILVTAGKSHGPNFHGLRTLSVAGSHCLLPCPSDAAESTQLPADDNASDRVMVAKPHCWKMNVKLGRLRLNVFTAAFTPAAAVPRQEVQTGPGQLALCQVATDLP